MRLLRIEALGFQCLHRNFYLHQMSRENKALYIYKTKQFDQPDMAQTEGIRSVQQVYPRQKIENRSTRSGNFTKFAFVFYANFTPSGQS